MKSFMFTLMTIVILCCGNARAAGLQYYWLTPDKVYLWNSADDSHPLVATRDSGSGGWSLNSVVTDEPWRAVLRTVVDKYSTAETVNKYSDQELWQVFLAKLREEFNPGWATPRQPAVEVYLRSKNTQSVEVIVIWTEASGTKRGVFPFQLGSDGSWEKEQDIPIVEIFGVGLKSEQLRRIFDIPIGARLPDGKAGWTRLWDQWIKGFLVGETIKPIMYLDERKTWRWLWRERLDPTAESPSTFRQMLLKPPPTSSSTTPSVKGGGRPVHISRLSIWITAALALVLVGLVLLLARRTRMVRNALSKLRKILPAPKQQRIDWFSRDGLLVLHEATKAEYARKAIPSNEPLGLLLSATLDWVYQEYLRVLNSSDFANKSNDIAARTIDDYKAKLGVSGVSDSVLKERLSLGRASESTVLQIPTLEGLSGVAKALNSKKVDLHSEENWLTNWPIIVMSLDELLLTSEKRCGSLKTELSNLKTRHDEQLKTDAKQSEAAFTTRLKDLQEQLKSTTDDRNAVHEELTRANKNLLIRAGDLSEAQKCLEQAREGLVDLQNKKRTIQEVRKLSKYLRQWVEGLLGQLERNAKAERKQPEIRPVALLMALVDFSLLQLCFSITDDNAVLRKGMAHNIQTLGQLLGDDQTRAEFGVTLRGIEEGVDQALVELKRGGYVPDVQLFRTFLTRLRTDMAADPGTFFVDVDSEDGRIVAAS